MNILDPIVKIGGWGLEEQAKIFELMKVHHTSWSTISKSLNGRTENSIKNYFYSTVRRVQASPVMEFLSLVKDSKPLPSFTSPQQFAEKYELDKLNRLGEVMCLWLSKGEESRQEHEVLFKYLMEVIVDEKRKLKLKDKKEVDRNSQNRGETRSSEEMPGKTSGTAEDRKHLPFINPKNLNGVHPLLPLALYGGLANLKAQSLFQAVCEGARQEVYEPAPKPFLRDDDQTCSDISVPIPQKTTKPSTTGKPEDQQIQKSLVKIIMKNLSNVVENNKNNTQASPNKSAICLKCLLSKCRC